MNREQAKQLLPIIQAFADGEDVQFDVGNGWCNCISPTFYPDCQWRAKPKLQERWLVVDRDGDARGNPRGFFEESAARCAMEHLVSIGGSHAPYRVAHLREVTA